jgi:simple sugar transport system substrate-binding protein
MRKHKVHPKVEEAVETLDLNPVTRRRLLAGSGLASASLAATALLSACGGDDSNTSDSGAVGNFPKTPNWKFVFVNHVTTNPFFVPTQYGAEDASKLLGVSYQWTGSANSTVGEMVTALNTAVSGKADGIAVAVVDKDAFRAPVDQALDAGIPVVSYNADGARDDVGTNRLAYIGQGLYESGYELGKRAASMVDSGSVVAFIATPGALNIQPRIDGAQQAIKDSGKALTFSSQAADADVPKALSIIDAYVNGHKDLAAILAVDAGDTQSVGQVVKKYNLRSAGKLKVAGGFDLTPETLAGIKDGSLDFTIDQQPYLQGFLPVLALYMFKLSGGLVVPVQTNTGLSFVTKENVDPYQSTQTRYEGSTTDKKLVSRSGAIAHQ